KDANKVDEIISLWKINYLSVSFNVLDEWKSNFILSVLSKNSIPKLGMNVSVCQLNDPCCKKVIRCPLSIASLYRGTALKDKQPGINYLFGLE
ncbi:hypothetical protein PENTCL1PPCAC_969, partial [Pristionchus entomophagus]